MSLPYHMDAAMELVRIEDNESGYALCIGSTILGTFRSRGAAECVAAPLLHAVAAALLAAYEKGAADALAAAKTD